MTVLIALFGFALLITILVVWHEGGHYVASRLFNIRVREASLGVGPVLWQRRLGETHCQLRLFPVGGFVRPMTAEEFESNDPDIVRAFDRQARWKQIIVYLAGPLSNLVLAWLCWAIVGVIGISDFAPTLSTPPAGTQAATLGVRAGDKLLAVEGSPVFGIMDGSMRLLSYAGGEASLRFERHNGIYERTFSLADVDISTGSRGILLGKLGLVPRIGAPQIGGLVDGYPAQGAGLRVGDRIWAVNHQSMQTIDEVSAAIRAAAGKPVVMTVSHAGEPQDTKHDITVEPKANEQGVWQIGINLSGRPDTVTVRYNPIESLWFGYQKLMLYLNINLQGLGEIAGGKTEAQNAVIGPVGIAKLAGDAVSSGAVVFIEMVALMSIALAIMNLLPIPVLDGGMIVVLLVESVLRRSFLVKTRMAIQFVGLLIIALIFVWSFSNDLDRILH